MSEIILRAGPIGWFVPVSHASTVFVETPITAANTAYVNPSFFRIAFISSADISGKGSILRVVF